MQRNRERGRRLVAAVKAAGCMSCPEKHLACLDFHHRDPSQKRKSGRGGCIAEMVARGASIDALLEEMAKCDVLCSNCHRKHHAEAQGAR